jgi:hypothetical protein
MRGGNLRKQFLQERFPPQAIIAYGDATRTSRQKLELSPPETLREQTTVSHNRGNRCINLS